MPGGYIEGPGGECVPVLITAGEWRISAATVKRYGETLLKTLASGGPVNPLLWEGDQA